MKFSDLYDKIKALRRYKGFTQAEFAEKLGLDVKSVQNIENGKTDISISRLQQIYMVFGFSDLKSFIDFDHLSYSI